MANNNIQNQIDSELNNLNGESNTDNQADAIGSKMSEPFNNMGDKIGNSISNKLGTLKENKNHKPIGGNLEDKVTDNKNSSDKKSNLKSNLNRFKGGSNNALQRARERVRNAKRAAKATMRMIRLMIHLVLAIVTNPIMWILLLVIVVIAVLLSIFSWFNFNNDNINGSFYSTTVQNDVKYDAHTNEVVESKLSVSNVLGGVFFEYYARNSYYYTITPPTDNDGNVLPSGKRALSDKEYNSVKQHTVKDTKDSDFKINDKFGTEAKFTLNSIMLMTLNKHLNNQMGDTYYYPEQFIQPLYNSCTIADNENLYKKFIEKYEADDSNISNEDYLKVKKRKDAKDKGWDDLALDSFNEIKCERINIFNNEKKSVSALSAKYEEVFLTSESKEIDEETYNKKQKEGGLVYKGYKTTENAFENGTWSWGIAPIFNYKEYNEYDEIRNIKIATVPVWNKEKQIFDNLPYDSLNKEAKEKIDPKIKKTWSNISQNENSVYLIDKIITYMGNAENGTELQENLTMSNYSAFSGSQQKEKIDIERLLKAGDLSESELMQKKILEVVYKDKSYKNVKLKIDYKEADKKKCEKEKDMCNAGPLSDDYDSKICSLYTKCNDKYDENGNICNSDKYDNSNMKQCLARIGSSQQIIMVEENGDETILAENIEKLGETKIYYEDTVEAVLQYAGDLFEFRANYTTDFAKVDNVSFDYIQSYINNYVLITPFENHENPDGRGFCTNVFNTSVSNEDYVKFYAGEEMVSPKSSIKENEEKVQKTLDEYKENDNDTGKKSIALVDPYIRAGGSYDCKDNPLKCILYDEISQVKSLDGLGPYTHKNICNPTDRHCVENTSQEPLLCVKTPVPTNETKNMTELSADTRSYSQYLQIADLFGMKVGSDMDDSSTNNGTFSGALIQGDLCVHPIKQGAPKTYMEFNKVYGNAPVTAYLYKGLNLKTRADLLKYFIPSWHGTIENYIENVQYAITHYDEVNPPKLIIDDKGFILTEDGFYAVALGSFYGTVGDKFIFTTEDGHEIKVVKTDEKSDSHTDENHCYHLVDNSTIEFVMDRTVLHGNKDQATTLRPELKGKLIAVKKVVSDGNTTPDTNTPATTERPDNEQLTSETGIAIGTNAQKSEILKIINDASFDEIRTVANTYGVDANLVASLSAYASGGVHNGDNCKKDGRCGFMGIYLQNNILKDDKISVTAYNFEKAQDETQSFSYDDLKDKSTNIKAGIMILAQHLRTYRYNPLLALYSYNRGHQELESAINEYSKKAKINKEDIYQKYSDISWRAYAKQEGYTFIEGVLNYFPATYLNFRTIDNDGENTKTIIVTSLNSSQNGTEENSNDNTLAGRLQNKISTLMSGGLIDENWEGLYPDKPKDTTEHDYTSVDGETVKGVDYYQKHVAPASNGIDVDAIIKNAYIVGTNNSIEDYDKITDEDWEQKFLESFGRRTKGSYITTNLADYFPDPAFALLSSEQLSLYQPYGVNKNTDTGKKQNHTYIGIKTSTGAKISNVNKGKISHIEEKDGGFQIFITHGDMSVSEFRKLKTVSEDLKVGQEIDAGTIVGTAGEDAFRYSLRVNGHYVNPEWMLHYGQSGTFITDGGNYTIVGDSVLGNSIAQKALSKLNLPYSWGGCHSAACIANPNSTVFDCSGFVTWALTQAGVNTNGPQYTKSLVKMGGSVADISQAQAGDVLLFSKTSNPSDVHHAAIYLGNGMMVHTPTTGQVSKVSKVWSHEKVFIRRIY